MPVSCNATSLFVYLPEEPKKLNEDFQRIADKLGMPIGRESGYTLHALRRFFETFCINAAVPQCRSAQSTFGWDTGVTSRWGPSTTRSRMANRRP